MGNIHAKKTSCIRNKKSLSVFGWYKRSQCATALQAVLLRKAFCKVFVFYKKLVVVLFNQSLTIDDQTYLQKF